MSEISDRVAQAIAQNMPNQDPALYHYAALAAIGAMRDPPPSIIAAVETMAEDRYNACPGMQRWYGEDVWNSGVDAALAGEEPAEVA